MMKPLVVVMLLTRIAAADPDETEVVSLARTCAEATEEGLLDEPGRAIAKRRLARALEELDLFVVDDHCQDTYRVAHLKVGSGTVIRIAGPNGSRRWTNPDPKALPEIYRKMVTDLLHAPIDSDEGPGIAARPPIAAPLPPTATPLDRFPSAPFRVAEAPPAPFPTPSLVSSANRRQWYASLGAGGLAGGGAGISATIGYRLESGTLMFDAAARLFSVSGSQSNGSQGSGASVGGLKVGVLATSRQESVKLYAGGGLGFSATTITEPNFNQQSGSGGVVHGTAGMWFGDAKTRPFLEAELTLPLYKTRAPMTGTSAYPASFGLALGLAI